MAETLTNARMVLEVGGVQAKGRITAFKKGGVRADNPQTLPQGMLTVGEVVDFSEVTLDLADLPSDEHDILRALRGADAVLRSLSTRQAWRISGLSCTEPGSSDGNGSIGGMTFAGDPAEPI